MLTIELFGPEDSELYFGLNSLLKDKNKIGLLSPMKNEFGRGQAFAINQPMN